MRIETIDDLRWLDWVSYKAFTQICRHVYDSKKFGTRVSEVTLKELFETFGEDEIASWRGVGLGVARGLKSLL